MYHNSFDVCNVEMFHIHCFFTLMGSHILYEHISYTVKSLFYWESCMIQAILLSDLLNC